MSLLTDHMVFSPKFRGKVLVGEVGESCERVIKRICKELGVEVIDIAVGEDHVHLFVQYPPKYSLSKLAMMVKGRSSKELRKRFPSLVEWCPNALWAPSVYHGSVGQGFEVVEKYIRNQGGRNVKGRLEALEKAREQIERRRGEGKEEKRGETKVRARHRSSLHPPEGKRSTNKTDKYRKLTPKEHQEERKRKRNTKD